MIFHRHKKFTYPVPPLTLNNAVLTETSQTKFLGVTIQQQLYWHNHIKEVRNKIAKQCGIIYLTRDALDTKSLTLIYYSLIYSNLGGASKEALQPLNVVQKRAIRTIGRLNKRDHTNNTFHNLNIL